MEAHLWFFDHDPFHIGLLVVFPCWKEVVKAEQQRREFTLSGRPGHKWELRLAMGELQAPGVLLILLDTDCAAVKNRLIDEAAVLLLQDAVRWKEAVTVAPCEAIEQVLA